MRNTDFISYARKSSETAIYPHRGRFLGLMYVTLGLAGEAGEFANKVKKLLRDHNGVVTAGFAELAIEELGDVLWYLGQICEELGISFGDVALTNIEKLQSRKERGVLKGSGDNR